MHFLALAPGTLTAFFQVVMIDLMLAGDNAVVIGLAASGLPRHQRAKAIFIGIIAATVLRIVFAVFTVQLLKVVGLLLAGGLLLLWVCWKMWRELRSSGPKKHAAGPHQSKTLAQAARQIVIADISMSLDNVLGVAGASRDHPQALVFGLTLSVLLMGAAAGVLARVLERRRWIAYVGLFIVLYVALSMIYRGALELL